MHDFRQAVVIGMLLKVFRTNTGMTQNCVASLSGVSASLYSLFESGKRIPSAKRLDSISSVLQLDSITRSQIKALVANTKGLSVEDAGLSDEA